MDKIASFFLIEQICQNKETDAKQQNSKSKHDSKHEVNLIAEAEGKEYLGLVEEDVTEVGNIWFQDDLEVVGPKTVAPEEATDLVLTNAEENSPRQKAKYQSLRDSKDTKKGG